MKKNVLEKFLLMIVPLIISGSLTMCSNGLFSTTFDQLNQKDYKRFAHIGEQLFLLCDKGDITVGEKISSDNFENRPGVEKALLKYKDKIAYLHYVDKGVILLSFGAVFQSMEGIAVTRNNAQLKTTYENTGFDTGTLRYSELVPTVYRFNAGL